MERFIQMKTRIAMCLILAILTLLATPQFFAQSSAAPKPAEATVKAPAKAKNTKSSDPGQQKFQANCGRCHSAPEQLSPTITGTVVRHMRVRATLSAQDEKDILKVPGALNFSVPYPRHPKWQIVQSKVNPMVELHRILHFDASFFGGITIRSSR